MRRKLSFMKRLLFVTTTSERLDLATVRVCVTCGTVHVHVRFRPVVVHQAD